MNTLNKISMLSISALGLLAMGQLAQADSSIRCASQIVGGTILQIDRANNAYTGVIDGIRMEQPGNITLSQIQKSQETSYDFDTGEVKLRNRQRDLTITRIHGRLDVNKADPARSMIHTTQLSRVCSGIVVFGHCSGSWEVIENGAQSINEMVSCHSVK